ncbi:MAG TPA: hypothetical protein VG722_08990, partial [Tepidisphaeraceae bacterium]|nr:hypothetical protein [Tepidisphaeraceae bacterium]
MIELIDTHQHLWDLSRHRYSWCVGVPKLHRSFTMGDYVAAASEMHGTRLIGAVHIEADVDEPFMVDEIRWVLSQAADPATPTIAAVGCCRPESSEREFRSFLEQFTENTHL